MPEYAPDPDPPTVDADPRLSTVTTPAAPLPRRPGSLLIRGSMVTLLTLGAVAYLARDYLAPEVDEATPETVRHRETVAPYFDGHPDGNILGQPLVYMDGKTRVEGEFILGDEGVMLRLNKHMLASKDMIQAPPELLSFLGIKSDDPKALIRGIRKQGNDIVIDLVIKKSHCAVPGPVVLDLARQIEEKPDRDSISHQMPYSLHGRITAIPGIIQTGHQTVNFSVKKLPEPKRHAYR